MHICVKTLEMQVFIKHLAICDLTKGAFTETQKQRILHNDFYRRYANIYLSGQGVCLHMPINTHVCRDDSTQ